MCLFIFPNITLAQRLILNGQMAQRLGIVASEKPDIGQAIIYVHRSGDDPGLICKPIMRSKRSELCSVDFMGQLVQSVSIEVQAPGYKRWTRNAIITWRKGTNVFNSTANIDIGKVDIMLSDRPKVEHVKYNMENGDHVFDIAFFNPFEREILIKELTIRAGIPSYANRQGIPEDQEANGCGEPPNEIFKIAHKMTITGKDDGGKLYATYQELTDKNRRDYTAIGKVIINGCTGKGYLVLALSAMFYVAPRKHSLVRVIFPQKVIIKKRYYNKKQIAEEDKDHYKGLPPIENMLRGIVDRFNPWDFCFRTEDRNELDFGARVEKLRPGFAKIIKNDFVTCRFSPDLQE